MNHDTVIIRRLGQQDYNTCWQAMRQFTQQRNDTTLDEIWLLEHPAVFTQGQNGKPEHLLNPGTIPVIKTDRGGQITYHGPGQLITYTLVNLKRKHLNVREMVTVLEKSVIMLLAELGIAAEAKPTAPGIYINGDKICSIGLRIRHGCSYHGIALNINMDLEPFTRINPCGFTQLKMTQLSAFNVIQPVDIISAKLVNSLAINLGYTKHLLEQGNS